MSNLRAVGQSLIVILLHFSFSEQTSMFLLFIQLIFTTIKKLSLAIEIKMAESWIQEKINT